AFMLADICFHESRKAETKVEHCCAREGVRVIVTETSILSSEEVTRRTDTVDHPSPTVARLHAIVVRESEEEPLLLANHLVKAIAFRVKRVGARVTADEIKSSLRVTG